MKPERPTETIRFDTGISVAEFASGDGGAPGGERQKQLLPGSTTVSEALSNIFPEGESVIGEIMSALVAGNSAYLRTPAGFGKTARSALVTLSSMKGLKKFFQSSCRLMKIPLYLKYTGETGERKERRL